VISRDLNAALFQSFEAALNAGDEIVQLSTVEAAPHLAKHREVVLS
jgi:hypothetical protein